MEVRYEQQYKFQRKLFPLLEEEIGPLNPTHLRLNSIQEVIRIERFARDQLPGSAHCGRPPADRKSLARAFVAKVVFKLKYTRQQRDNLLSDKQLRMICGWDRAGVCILLKPPTFSSHNSK
jgi:hypothetical protein